jgi:uncharacterized membrane protein YphA (DoxX/SURF4 family)
MVTAPIDTANSQAVIAGDHNPHAFGRLGLALIALGLLGLGVLGLIYADFALQWVPVPIWVPARTLLAYANALLLLFGAVSALMPNTRRIGTLVLCLSVLSWVILVHAPRVVTQLTNVGYWNALCESLAIASAAWVGFLLGILDQPRSTRPAWLPRVLWAEQGVHFGRRVFAITPLVFGLAHFLYAGFTASMVPAWIPGALFWAYFTGCGHVAAGISILTGVMARLGSTLLAVMMSSFVILLHVPRVVGDPGNRVEWTMLCMSLALSGSAWVVAGSFLNPGTKVDNQALRYIVS